MDISFNNIKELYERVNPALKTKVRELQRNKIDYINEVDIWNYLIETKWTKRRGLMLSDIVDDILNTENSKLEDYVKEEMKKRERQANVSIEII